MKYAWTQKIGDTITVAGNLETIITEVTGSKSKREARLLIKNGKTVRIVPLSYDQNPVKIANGVKVQINSNKTSSGKRVNLIYFVDLLSNKDNIIKYIGYNSSL